jgi:dolichol kinase
MITGLEISRKIVHLSSLSIPIGYALTSKQTALTVLIPLTMAFLGVDLLRRFHPGTASLFKKYLIGKVLREKESNTLMESTYSGPFGYPCSPGREGNWEGADLGKNA